MTIWSLIRICELFFRSKNCSSKRFGQNRLILTFDESCNKTSFVFVIKHIICSYANVTNKILLLKGLPMEFTSIIAFARDSPEIFGYDRSNKTVLWDGSTMSQITKDKLDHLLQITNISTVEHWTRQQVCIGNIAAGNNIGEWFRYLHRSLVTIYHFLDHQR